MTMTNTGTKTREKNISNKTNPDEVVAPILLLTAYGVLEI